MSIIIVILIGSSIGLVKVLVLSVISVLVLHHLDLKHQNQLLLIVHGLSMVVLHLLMIDHFYHVYHRFYVDLFNMSWDNSIFIFCCEIRYKEGAKCGAFILSIYKVVKQFINLDNLYL